MTSLRSYAIPEIIKGSGPLSALVTYSQAKEQRARDAVCVSKGGAALRANAGWRWQDGAIKERIASALAIIQDALSHATKPMIAFSGGKDSIATMALVHTLDPSVVPVWSDDELEYPEVVAYMRTLMDVSQSDANEPTLVWLQGASLHAGWFEPWTNQPFARAPDTRMIWLAKGEADSRDWAANQGYDCTFLGTRAGESHRRRDYLIANGPTYTVSRGTGLHCCPLWDWTEADVWALIAGWQLPYPTAYDRMVDAGVPRDRLRIGPLPLARREDLEAAYPELLAELEERYGERWA